MASQERKGLTITLYFTLDTDDPQKASAAEQEIVNAYADAVLLGVPVVHVAGGWPMEDATLIEGESGIDIA